MNQKAGSQKAELVQEFREIEPSLGRPINSWFPDSMFMSEPMIEVEGLTKRFGTFTAVDHVSFTVGKGSIFGFLGPNGSGKTTVIRMLCGILQPTEGTARIGGHDIVRDLEPIKEMIGYMSQKFSLYDELTVNENLIFAGKLYGLSGRELTRGARK